MPIVVQKEWYTKEQVQAEREKIFVFGDNLTREGTGGQAKACRGEPNTIGIVTKWDKYRNPGSYMYDSTYDINVKQITRDFEEIGKILGDRYKKNQIIVFPADGFGTGLANLSINAPRTLEFITKVTNYYLSVSHINQLDDELKALEKEIWPNGWHNYMR